MQTVYILNNSNGILLGLYRAEHLAKTAVTVYQKEQAITDEPTLYLYKVSSYQVDQCIGNNFECIWSSDTGKKF